MSTVTLTLTEGEAVALDMLRAHQKQCPKCSKPRTLPSSTPVCGVGLIRMRAAAVAIDAHRDDFAAAFPKWAGRPS